jgi:serine/threonine protein kinase
MNVSSNPPPTLQHPLSTPQVGQRFYIVAPICAGGELYEHIVDRGYFSEEDALIVIRDLCSALHALHSRGMLHLDIKPENILYESTDMDAKIMLTDFGLAKDMSKVLKEQNNMEHPDAKVLEKAKKDFIRNGELHADKIRGTLGYLAPELILTGFYSAATDIFAAGVVLYIMLVGKPPFYCKSTRVMFLRTIKGTYSLKGPEWDGVTPETKALLRSMLEVPTDTHIYKFCECRHLDAL